MPFWFAPRGITPEYQLDRPQRRGLITRIAVVAGFVILLLFTLVDLLVMPLVGGWVLDAACGDPQRYACGLVLLVASTATLVAGVGAWWWLRRQAVLRAYDRQLPPLVGGAALGRVRPETVAAPAPSNDPTPADRKGSTS